MERQHLSFPDKYHRKADDVDLLWNLFECTDDPSKITSQMFQDILSDTFRWFFKAYAKPVLVCTRIIFRLLMVKQHFI